MELTIEQVAEVLGLPVKAVERYGPSGENSLPVPAGRNSLQAACSQEVGQDTLLVLGAYGHGLIKGIMFGSKLERIQSTLPNNQLIAGPKYAAIER